MVKINKIKKSGKKYVISLDNGKDIITYDDVIIKYGLLYHRYINEKLLDQIYSDTLYYKTYNKVLDMISRKVRCEYEIRQYLSNNNYNDIDKVVDNLKKAGLLDDLKYARAYTNDRINLTLDGPYKIKKHLREQKINDQYINEVLSSIDNDIINDHIDKVILKKINSNKKYTAYILKQKIVSYLVNLGYDKENIIRRIEKFEIKVPDTKKEMNKILYKLKKKYDGQELLYRLKNKFYSKGYNKEEIEDFIKNSSLI